MYGRVYCPTACASTALHDICKWLRILNAVRDPTIGLPLTLAQLEALSLPVLVARMVGARRYLLAFRIAEMLGAGQEQVMPVRDFHDTQLD